MASQCYAGALRTSFYTQSYFNTMSLIGRLNIYNLNKVNNLLLSIEGYMSPHDLIFKSESDAIYSRFVARVIAIVFLSLVVALIICYCVSRQLHLRNNQGNQFVKDYA